jgi:SAM-dependent methyltransferase
VERFDQSQLTTEEHVSLFNGYFSVFPWAALPTEAVGFDMGCGSGRWAKLVAQKVGVLHCIDPSSALNVAKRNLSKQTNCVFHSAGVSDHALPEKSMDFGYSLGVLHHVPDTAFDNRPFWFRWLWRATDILRRGISRLPHGARYWVSQSIAVLVYWPLARAASLAERIGAGKIITEMMPLGSYRHLSFYTMRTDALDRFGTRLEQRFTRKQITEMMQAAGLENVQISDAVPYWCAVGFRVRQCAA